MDPTILTALPTIFSGAQLAVIVFVLLELRNLRAQYADMKQQNEDQDTHIAAINTRLAHVMGSLKLPYKDEI